MLTMIKFIYEIIAITLIILFVLGGLVINIMYFYYNPINLIVPIWAIVADIVDSIKKSSEIKKKQHNNCRSL